MTEEQDPALRALIRGLDALPDLPVPDGLDARVLSGRSEAPSTDGRGWRWGALGAAAAGLIVAVGLGTRDPPPTQVVVTVGHQRVEGLADVAAGGLVLHLDGVALVDVEPARGVARGVGDPKEPPMIRPALAGAAAGALVTFSVLEGSAWLSGPGRPDQPLAPGDRVHVEAPAEPAGAQPRSPTAPPLPTDEPLEAALARVTAERDAYKEQLDLLQFEGAVLRGQLEASVGVPSEWPADAPDALKAPALSAAFAAVVAAVPGAGVISVECEEFPCIAVLRAPDGDEGVKSLADQVRDAAANLTPGDPLGISMFASRSDDGEGELNLLGVALSPGKLEQTVEDRLAARAREALEAAEGR
jgi:hypothetical protein